MKTSTFLLVLCAFFYISTITIAQTVFNSTSHTIVNKSSGRSTDVSSSNTFEISRYNIKMISNGLTQRTFRSASGYTFGFRDWFCPATYGDSEYCEIGLKEDYPPLVIIYYKHLGMSILYRGSFN